MFPTPLSGETVRIAHYDTCGVVGGRSRSRTTGSLYRNCCSGI